MIQPIPPVLSLRDQTQVPRQKHQFVIIRRVAASSPERPDFNATPGWTFTYIQHHRRHNSETVDIPLKLLGECIGQRTVVHISFTIARDDCSCSSFQESSLPDSFQLHRLLFIGHASSPSSASLPTPTTYPLKELASSARHIAQSLVDRNKLPGG